MQQQPLTISTVSITPFGSSSTTNISSHPFPLQSHHNPPNAAETFIEDEKPSQSSLQTPPLIEERNHPSVVVNLAIPTQAQPGSLPEIISHQVKTQPSSSMKSSPSRGSGVSFKSFLSALTFLILTRKTYHNFFKPQHEREAAVVVAPPFKHTKEEGNSSPPQHHHHHDSLLQEPKNHDMVHELNEHPTRNETTQSLQQHVFNPHFISSSYNLKKDFYSKSNWTQIVFDYIMEWLVILVVGIIAAILFQVPYPQTLYFRLDDPRIGYPLLGIQTVPFNLIVIAFVVCIPIGSLLLFQLVFVRNLHDTHHMLLGYIQSLCFSMLFMMFFWFFYPDYRPSFLQECNPIAAKVQALQNERTNHFNTVVYYLPHEICSQPEKYRGMKVNNTPAFPSGHAANLFAVWIFLLLYVFAKTKALSLAQDRNRQDHRNGTLTSTARRGILFFPFVALLILACLIWIGVFSRVLDYQHTWTQVIVGTIIGVLCGIIVYMYKYGSLFGHNSHIPLYYYWKDDYNSAHENQQQSSSDKAISKE
ncbi:hypothetical protein C9374_012334 [Naegleria lovaniensis]|uniref:Phosphatidic acid phosphatase type 2/haloperoxidase domain-containing protein n=1 Tax=Naegleria lovaniensis TaxID=51637 RepID=A0AA88GFS4_NAELO|nr:uncharacterized protein C9374_012334 [Naegleria lovaniensis]KAG2373231.1 hypothetical protein C9374_012334 [Naegleria lovaniensis]